MASGREGECCHRWGGRGQKKRTSLKEARKGHKKTYGKKGGAVVHYGARESVAEGASVC